MICTLCEISCLVCQLLLLVACGKAGAWPQSLPLLLVRTHCCSHYPRHNKGGKSNTLNNMRVTHYKCIYFYIHSVVCSCLLLSLHTLCERAPSM